MKLILLSFALCSLSLPLAPAANACGRGEYACYCDKINQTSSGGTYGVKTEALCSEVNDSDFQADCAAKEADGSTCYIQRKR